MDAIREGLVTLAELELAAAAFGLKGEAALREALRHERGRKAPTREWRASPPTVLATSEEGHGRRHVRALNKWLENTVVPVARLLTIEGPRPGRGDAMTALDRRHALRAAALAGMGTALGLAAPGCVMAGDQRYR